MLPNQLITIFFNIILIIKSLSCSLDFNYHNHDSLTALLRNYTNNYPNKAFLYSIGKSVQNRDLWVLALSDSNPDKVIPLRPEAKYIGNMHGKKIIYFYVLKS